MPLRTLLYRCPRCGRDPTEGARDEVRCPGCGCTYTRAASGGRIRVEETEENPQEVLASRLVEAIDALDGPLPAARTDDGRIWYEAAVRVRRAVDEAACHHGDELLGFHERLGSSEKGVLRVTDDALELIRADTVRARWNLLDLRAVQASSSAIQVHTATGELVHFHFETDSAFRWEQLLYAVLRMVYREEGKGEIVEFRPRIATE